jgi:seryl-tRNA synthetase
VKIKNFIIHSSNLDYLMAPLRLPYVCLDCRLRNQWAFLQRNFSSSTRSNDHGARLTAAPKPNLDLKHIKQNPELYSRNCIERNYRSYADYPFKIQQLAEEARELDHKLRTPRSRIRELGKSIAKLAGSADPSNASGQLTALREEAQRLKYESQTLSSRQANCVEEIHRLALSLPNLTSPETPSGNEPKLIQYINFDPESPPSWLSAPNPDRSHVIIGTTLGLIDFTSAATSTGWGWYFLTNEGALLEHALVQYALTVAIRRGWKVVSPPSLVYSYISEACGFQPRDQNNEQQIWSIEQGEKDRGKPQRSLTGTAEIPLAAMYAGRDIDPSTLPIKLVGSSRCYRAEAGARGTDTKGLYRVHEFTKVELFGWVDSDPEASWPSSVALFSEILAIQTEILTSLNLPCRILEMPASDLGASASRKRDIEVLFPSRLRSDSGGSDIDAAWGEVTSASICTDYQSRRLETRVRGGNISGARFPHTVNGTAVAVPRIIAAILENCWDETRGVVVVPEVLRDWMGGMQVIGAQGSQT